MLHDVLTVIYILFQFYGTIMTVGIILTWIPSSMNLGFFRLISHVGDWYLGHFRGILIIGSLDIGPVIGFLIYQTMANAIWI